MQRTRNIKASFEKYLYDGLVTGDSKKLALPGVPFESRDLAAWCEMQWLPATTQFAYRLADSNGNSGREVTILAQVMCFARRHSSAGAVVNKWTLPNLVDVVSGRLPIAKEITVYNYANGSAAIGTLQIVDVSDGPTFAESKGKPTTADLDAHVYTVTLQYTAAMGTTA